MWVQSRSVATCALVHDKYWANFFSLPVLTQVPETFWGAATRKTCSLDSLKHSFWENKTNLNMVSLSSPNVSVQNLAQIPVCAQHLHQNLAQLPVCGQCLCRVSAQGLCAPKTFSEFLHHWHSVPTCLRRCIFSSLVVRQDVHLTDTQAANPVILL